MDKITIRKNCLRDINSYFIRDNIDESKIMNYVNNKKNDYIVSVLLKDDCDFDTLEKEYAAFANGLNSDYFSWMYVVKEDYGTIIDDLGHIYLCHYQKKWFDCIYSYLNWFYIDRRVYLADAWWFSASEIINDFLNLNVVDFFKKYKGC